MGNELKHIIDEYNWSSDSTIFCYDTRDKTSERSSEYLVNFIPYLNQFERPDMYAEYDNTVLFIEHFSFNSSRSIEHGGSLQKYNENINNRAFQEKIRVSNNEVITSVNRIDNEADFTSYVDNFNSVFKKHLDKVDEYIDNLKSKNIYQEDKNLIKAFFIEDDSDWNVVSHNDKIYDVNILYSNIFWDFIDNYDVKNKLDFILIGFDGYKEPRVYIVDMKSDFNYVGNGFVLNESNFKAIGGLEWRGAFSIKGDENE